MHRLTATANHCGVFGALLCVAAIVCLPTPLAAQTQDLENLRIRGWGPDAQLVGGGGFGLGGSLDNPFTGRLRLGALYAREPWVWNFGVEGNIGALREWGFGGEVEVNHFKGMFATFGVGTAQLEDAALNVTVGYTIVGLEWQHRFTPHEPQDALLLVMRAPVGLWWFLTQRDKRDDDDDDGRSRSQPSGATKANDEGGTDVAAVRAADAAQLADQVRVERELAAQYEASGRLLEAEHALGRAYAYDPQPELLLELARVEQAQGRRARAVADLERYLDAPAERRLVADTEQAKAQLAQLLPELTTLRLSLLNTEGNERVEIDGERFHGAMLGYDMRLDPGTHTLLVLRGDRAVARRVLEAAPGTLLRLEIDLRDPGALVQPAASPSSPQPTSPAPTAP